VPGIFYQLASTQNTRYRLGRQIGMSGDLRVLADDGNSVIKRVMAIGLGLSGP